VDLSEFLKSGISAVWGLLGVFVGSWLTGRNQKREREDARKKDQLSGFYAPMRAMRAEIKAKSELRVRVHAIAEELWAKKFEGIDDPEEKKRIDEGDWEKYERTLDYSNKQLDTVIIPLYRKMLEHFAANMALSEESTLEHYPAFVEFVEIWNRWMDKSLPGEVAAKLGQSEKKLYPLYDDIEANFKRLRDELKD
jgi:hypothetical protein